MPELVVQIQPQRYPSLDVPKALAALAVVAASVPEVSQFHIKKGRDRGLFLNVVYTVPAKSMVQLWRTLASTALGTTASGKRLRKASMVFCQGTRGWDNYKLLHHFNPKVPLDKQAGV